MTDKKRVLILCTGNSARSQMAEGLFRHEAGDRYEVFSAGTKPTQVRPEAMAVMSEIGIDISDHRSKSVDEFTGQEFDQVITVCDSANESCPVFPGKTQRIHWSFEDPAAVQGSEEERKAAFRKVRDQFTVALWSSWVKVFRLRHHAGWLWGLAGSTCCGIERVPAVQSWLERRRQVVRGLDEEDLPAPLRIDPIVSQSKILLEMVVGRHAVDTVRYSESRKKGRARVKNDAALWLCTVLVHSACRKVAYLTSNTDKTSNTD